ncbi:MAG: peroxidase family protein, partial [Mycobacterium sp.]
MAAAASAWADDAPSASSTDSASASTHRTDRGAAARSVASATRGTASRLASTISTTATTSTTSAAAAARPQQTIAPAPRPPRPGVIYRSIDGSGNSLTTTGLNAVGADFARIGTAHFSDGISALRTDLPNARTVSNLVVAGNAETPNAEGLSG